MFTRFETYIVALILCPIQESTCLCITRTSFFEHLTNSNVFIYWWSNLNNWILASNEWTSNIEPLLYLLKYSSNRFEHHLFWTSNSFEHVHLLVIYLEHPIFSFEQLNFKHSSTHHYEGTRFRFQMQPPIFDHGYYWPSASINDMAPAHNCKHCCQVQPQAVAWPQKKDTFHTAVKIRKGCWLPFS